MSKGKKIFLTVLFAVLTLAVIVDTFLLYIMWTSTPRGIELHNYENLYY